jgi:hypothetical protein
VTLLHTLSEGLHGSAIGKRVCGITVVSEDGAPSADHVLDLGIVECGPPGATGEPGELCIV